MDFSLFSVVQQGIRFLLQAGKHRLHLRTEPRHDASAPNTAIDLTHSKMESMPENIFASPAAPPAQPAHKATPLTWRDQPLFGLLASKLRTWKQPFRIFQPDTVHLWHQDLLRRVWGRRSRSEGKLR